MATAANRRAASVHHAAGGPDRSVLAHTASTMIERLTGLYGEPAWSTKDALSMLVIIILSQRTRDAQTTAGYRALKARYPLWEAVRDAPTAEVEQTIGMVTWPELKAPRIQAILRRIGEERGELSLDFLCELPLEQGVAWLDRLQGVGPKTIACTLLFSCRKPILPVDTHVHRVSLRVGLIGPRVGPEAAHPLLQALLPPDPRVIYNYHNSLLLHGQRVCAFSAPRCGRCPLTDLCAYYATVVAPSTARA